MPANREECVKPAPRSQLNSLVHALQFVTFQIFYDLVFYTWSYKLFNKKKYESKLDYLLFRDKALLLVLPGFQKS